MRLDKIAIPRENKGSQVFLSHVVVAELEDEFEDMNYDPLEGTSSGS